MIKIIFIDLLKLIFSKKINFFIIFIKIKVCEDYFINVIELYVDW